MTWIKRQVQRNNLPDNGAIPIPHAPSLPSMMQSYASWKMGDKQVTTSKTDFSVLSRIIMTHRLYLQQMNTVHKQFFQVSSISSCKGKTVRNESSFRFGPISMYLDKKERYAGHVHFPALLMRLIELLSKMLETRLSPTTGMWCIRSLTYKVLEQMPAFPATESMDLLVSGRMRFLRNNDKIGSLPYAAQFEMIVNNGKRSLIRITKGFAQISVMEREAILEPQRNHSNSFVPESPEMRLNEEQLSHFAQGRLDLCFGSDYAETATHIRTPAVPELIASFNEVVLSSVDNGRRIKTINASSSFKHHEPVGIGLCTDAMFQLLNLILAYSGSTLKRDGWRVVPCVGSEVTVTWEMPPSLQSIQALSFRVSNVLHNDGEEPEVSATLDIIHQGKQVGRVTGACVALVLDFPISSSLLSSLVNPEKDKEVFQQNGFRYGAKSLLHGALGKPSEALGPLFWKFDKGTQMPRLPGPPFLFMSRIIDVRSPVGEVHIGTVMISEYDIPDDAWYFQNTNGVMPFSVLMEAALQPCGWLSGYMGIPLQSDQPLYFRNLDGNGTQYRDIYAVDGMLRTIVTVKNVSRVQSTFLQTYEVECFIANERVYHMETVFGHFPASGLASQAGISVEELPSIDPYRVVEVVTELTTTESSLKQSLPWLGGKLQMIDRILSTTISEVEDRVRVIAEKTITPDQWFFKAHFFQDSVQPGSLGIEAILQVLQWYMKDRGMDQDFYKPVFEAIHTKTPMSWKYRGQVFPQSKSVRIVVDIFEEEKQRDSAFVLAKATLWVDGQAIYMADSIGMRMKESKTELESEYIVDPNQEWLQDHCPTYTLPVMPFMFLMDDVMKAVQKQYPGKCISELIDVQIHGWFICDKSRTVRSKVSAIPGDVMRLNVTLSTWREATPAKLSKFEPVMTAVVAITDQYLSTNINTMEHLEGHLEGQNPSTENPYKSGRLFHGNSFYVQKKLAYGSNGSSSIMDLSLSNMPEERRLALVLDGITHAIPHDQLERWDVTIAEGHVAYPYKINQAKFLSAPDLTGEIRCEVRFGGFLNENKRFPIFQIQLMSNDSVWLEMEFVEIVFPSSRFVTAEGKQRRRFLQDKEFIPDLSLSRINNDIACLSPSEVRDANWLPGTLQTVYSVDGNANVLARMIAVKELAGKCWKVHPSRIILHQSDETIVTAYNRSLPFSHLEVKTEYIQGEWCAKSERLSEMNLTDVHAYWTDKTGVKEWIIWDVYRALVNRFVGQFHLTDPDSFKKVNGQPVLFLANHQTAVESLLFSYLTGGLREMPIVGMAKVEHSKSWIGRLLQMTSSYPPANMYRTMLLFDRSDQKSMLTLLQKMAGLMKKEKLSTLVHVEGTRATSSSHPPVQTMSSTLIDLAVSAQVPIVPVRFSNGLPRQDLGRRYEFPIGWGKQDYWIGAAIQPEELAEYNYAAKKEKVIAAINSLGPSIEKESPYSTNKVWEIQDSKWCQSFNVSVEWAVILQCLEELPEKSEQTSAFLEDILAIRPSFRGPNKEWLEQLFNQMKNG